MNLKKQIELSGKVYFDKPKKSEVMSRVEGELRAALMEKTDAESLILTLRSVERWFYAANNPPKKVSTDALAWCMLAASTDEDRAVLNGVYCDDGKYVATDGRRVHMADRPEKSPHKDGEFIDRKTGKVLSPEEYKEERGQFPNYKKVIPAWTEKETSELLNCRVEPGRNRDLFKAEIVVCDLCENPDGEMDRIVLNEQFFKDIVAGCYSDGRAHDCLSPATFTGPGGRLAVLMPIRDI